MPNDDGIEIPVTLDIKNVRPMRVLKPPFKNSETLLDKHRVPGTPRKPQFDSVNYAHIDPALVQLLRPRLARELRKSGRLHIPEDSSDKLYRRIRAHGHNFIEINPEGISKYFRHPEILEKYARVMPPGFAASRAERFIPDTMLSEITQPTRTELAREILDKNQKVVDDTHDIASNVHNILKTVMSFQNGFFEPVDYDEAFIRSLSGINDPTRAHLQWIERHYKRREFLERDHQLKLERQERRTSYINRIFGKYGLSSRDFKNVLDFGKKNFPIKDWEGTKLRFQNMGLGMAAAASTFLIKKTFTTILSVSKKILGVFTNAAKQSETFRTIMTLIFAPLTTMFTLLFVPLLVAMVPLIKTMFGWVVANKDAIMNVGEKLGEVFKSENLQIVWSALDGVLGVLDALATIFKNNASLIDTSSVSTLISSTVLAVTNMIQDILMGLVAFCYSAEGQAFINSVSLSVGKMIGTILTTLVALLPVMFQSIHHSVFGVIDGIFSTLIKTIFNMLDVMDRMTGGAISGFVNMIIDMVNSAINALNSINIFGFSPFDIPNVGHMSFGTMGSTISNSFDQGVVNNFNINNMMHIPNSSVLSDVMRTGVY